MNIEKGYIYHIYNQGNNQRKIFFKRDNYLFFLKKIKAYISPYADIIAWCLMPNHFHLMVLVREEEMLILENGKMVTADPNKITSHKMIQSHLMTTKKIKTRSINNSIAILLRSYTRAINKQENTSGSLFKSHTKAECLNCHKGLTPSFFNENGATTINIQDSKKQYPQVCFDYIHQNPVKAKMVTFETDYEFSSAKDYAEIRKGNLIDKKVALNFIDYKVIR